MTPDHSRVPPGTDVAIVGAGIAGLVTADRLGTRGIDAVVLEAADRVGGRLMARTSVLGSAVDLGGQWIGHGHHRFEELADELGARRFPMHSPGTPAMVTAVGPISATNPSMLAATVGLLGFEVASRLPERDTWTTTSVREWIDRIPSRRARRIVDVIVAVTCCADTSTLSIAAFLRLIRFQGGLSTMMKTTGGAQDALVVEGAGALAERLAHRLGDRVHTGVRVTAVDQTDRGVTVATPTTTIRARRVVIAVPPPMAARIAFRPPLPDNRVRSHHNTRMGEVYKAIAVYETPFWRQRRDAEAIMLGTPGCAVFDTTPPDGPGHLTMLVGGADAARIGQLSVGRRRETLLDHLEPHLGREVRRPAGWYDKVWHHDPYVGGGYASLPVMGTREGYYPVEHTPAGRIHWAGTETAAEHAGYVEGAIESAERVVTELVRTLGETG
ncbi:flavin monoamine oxidase family protein [Williamsia sterculiae]|uniref:Monoamine oxidase n=1 Tax=Williamsia sterculiae TaxID=1344003 RepID=A0A1N7EPI8_9NOCA|nr:FAD-dependent oxidoreductase [Williamsia sterculiae]SIR89974.1 monoamine oxidase [Williamsia sterculiae]